MSPHVTKAIKIFEIRVDVQKRYLRLHTNIDYKCDSFIQIMLSFIASFALASLMCFLGLGYYGLHVMDENSFNEFSFRSESRFYT